MMDLGKPEHIVEETLQERYVRGLPQVLVKRKGLKDPTWEPLKHVEKTLDVRNENNGSDVVTAAGESGAPAVSVGTVSHLTDRAVPISESGEVATGIHETASPSTDAAGDVNALNASTGEINIPPPPPPKEKKMSASKLKSLEKRHAKQSQRIEEKLSRLAQHHHQNPIQQTPGLTTRPICPGCGADFQSANPLGLGYLPIRATDEAAKGESIHARAESSDALTPREAATLAQHHHHLAQNTTDPDADISALAEKAFLAGTPPPVTQKRTICARCYALTQHRRLTRTYTPPQMEKLLSTLRVRPNCVVVCIVDAADFPASLLTGLSMLVGAEKPVLVVANKIDLLPTDVPLATVERSVRNRAVKWGIGGGVTASPASSTKLEKQPRQPLLDVTLTSATTLAGVPALCEKIRAHQQAGRDVFLVGCANVGKSALIGAMRKVAGLDVSAAPTVSDVPGTTVAVFDSGVDLGVGTAELETPVDGGTPPPPPPPRRQTIGKIFDTPGVHTPTQITPLLTPAELAIATPQKRLLPHTITISAGETLFVGGLFRLDFKPPDSSPSSSSSSSSPSNDTPSPPPSKLTLTAYLPSRLPLHRTKTTRATALSKRHRGTITPQMAARVMRTRKMAETNVSGVLAPPFSKPGPDASSAFPELEVALRVTVPTTHGSSRGTTPAALPKTAGTIPQTQTQTGPMDICLGGVGWISVAPTVRWRRTVVEGTEGTDERREGEAREPMDGRDRHGSAGKYPPKRSRNDAGGPRGGPRGAEGGGKRWTRS
ncbi:uncharacterized protein EV422DRAFT_336504 [Fimicolochytrium jonesii]|uniref:uncharacterized protein n=1 Tax=Fimicolochytrium jonesii TaxID=1396493 RepID=UPI0022FEC96B|nr:uncharacterized protein EV422DRAFT_336504 [Fimicolochytrium jonesii]KAI8815936.1 hypothetical protein EV422DRAFT_336504 [Fimicolochytrium jonesii]